MSNEEIESSFNAVLFYLQLCLGVWQFMKLTPVGALIKGEIGWLLGQLGLSRTYSLLHNCPGRVFKKANCFVLQADIPAERRGIESDQVNSLKLEYLGETFVLERKEENMLLVLVQKEENVLLVHKKMKYYITDMIWKELQNLKQVLAYGSQGPPSNRAAVAKAIADGSKQQAEFAKDNLQRAKNEALSMKTMGDSDYYNGTYGVPAEAATDARAAAVHRAASTARATAVDTLEDARKSEKNAREDARLAVEAAPSPTTLIVKGKRDFWREVITGGVMTFEEVMDAIILDNQHVSVRLSNGSLLPINLSVSEEKLLKILNLVALFLQIKKVVKVHWSIPFSLSCISALLEFATTIRVQLYSQINKWFCYIMHLICDPLPRSWRRQIYSLGKWVEGLTPSNDIQLKVVRGPMCAIIAEGAKVDKEDAKKVDLLEQPPSLFDRVIQKEFRCDPIKNDIIRCTYVIDHELCEIFSRSFPVFYVKCNNPDEFKKIITLVSSIAGNGCGSLICYGPNNKVRVRGFEESVTSYVNSGLPSVYTLDLGNVIVA